jgi:hypothetical protein
MVYRGDSVRKCSEFLQVQPTGQHKGSLEQEAGGGLYPGQQ